MIIVAMPEQTIHEGVPKAIASGYERADVELERLLAPDPAPAERVQADSAGHRGDPAAQVLVISFPIAQASSESATHHKSIPGTMIDPAVRTHGQCW
jgi:hypothetical protein